MSWVLFKKRLKRKWIQCLDPEFDSDAFAERFVFTEDDCDYFERERRIFNGKIYCLIENEDDRTDFFFRRLGIRDGREYYVGLDDNEEFSMVLKGFAYGTMHSAVDDDKTSSFMEELQEMLGNYLIQEVDNGDQ